VTGSGLLPGSSIDLCWTYNGSPSCYDVAYQVVGTNGTLLLGPPLFDCLGDFFSNVYATGITAYGQPIMSNVVTGPC
jgi:hypothetical protein